MTTMPISSIAAAAADVLSGLAISACESSNSTEPSQAQVKDALKVDAQAGGAAKPAVTPAAPAIVPAKPAPATTAPATTTTTASADGKQVFTENCAGCHTLKAAGASGQVGPNLDQLKPAAGTVEAKVNAGGGGMPAFSGQLSPGEIKAVATYVSTSAGA